MHGIEVRHLRYFMRVAQELHFGRAAEILGISQAPLSLQIRQLEQRLGVRLFDRTTRSVSLTPAGQALFESSGHALLGFQNALDEARTAGGLRAGRLRIGAMSAAVHTILPDTIERFARRAPAANLDISFHTTEEQLPMLTERKIDIAFIRPPRNSGGLEFKEVHREGFVALLPPNSPLHEKDDLRIADLKNENFIGFSDIRGIGYQDILLHHCRLAGYHPRIVQRVSHTKAVVVLVRAGLGVGIVPQWVEHETISGIHIRPLKELPEAISLVAAWRADGLNPFVQAFVECLTSR